MSIDCFEESPNIPFFDKPTTQIIIHSFALGADVAVNAIMGLPDIKKLEEVLKLEYNIPIAWQPSKQILVYHLSSILIPPNQFVQRVHVLLHSWL